MMGRQMSWSVATMMAIIVSRPQAMAVPLPVLAAVCRKLPRPGRRKSRWPSTNISQAIRKNQPPATETMEFQTRLMAA